MEPRPQIKHVDLSTDPKTVTMIDMPDKEYEAWLANNALYAEVQTAMAAADPNTPAAVKL